MFNKKKTLSTHHLEKAIKKSSSDKISIEDIMTAMNAGGFGLVLMFFSLPIIIPFPPPFPSLIAIPLIVFSIQMIIGFTAPKLPKLISQKTIERAILARTIEKSSTYLRKAEKLLKPRLLFLSTGICERILGLFILAFCISILIPLPFTNFLPGIGILIISFGLIGKDGIIIILGLAIGLIGTLVTFLTIFLGAEFIRILKDFISSLY